MGTSSSILLVVVVLLVAAAITVAIRAAAARRQRSERLRSTFGPEYDRTVQAAGSRKAAEQELRERRAKHAALELRPLSEQAREQFRSQWVAVQAHFVDAPQEALTEADELVTRLMRERGYPTDDARIQEQLLSVQHGKVLDGFRSGHAVEQESAAGRAGTEQIRQAMLDFRTVFAELLEDTGGSRKVGR